MLEYRDGYYQVSYKTPKFIDETVTDSRGKVTTRTLAVTSSIKEADQIVKNLSAQNPANQYKYRGECRTCRNGDSPLQDVRHIERLQREERQTVDQHHEDGVADILRRTERGKRRTEVVGTVAGHEECEKVRLEKSEERHRSRSHSRRV